MKLTDEQITAIIMPLQQLSSGISRVIASKPEVTRIALLSAVAHTDRLRPSELATALNMHQSQVTRQLQALEGEGFVEITPNPEDRRSWHVALTDAGGSEIQRLTEIGMTKWRRFLADWDADEAAELARLLTKLQESIQAVQQRPARKRDE